MSDLALLHVPDGSPISGYVLDLSCPECGSALRHVVSSLPLAGTEATAVAKCGGCRREWQVIVHLRHMPAERTEYSSERRRQRKAAERAAI